MEDKTAFPLFFYSTTACWMSTLISKTYTLFVCIKQLINMPLLNVITIRFSLVLMQHSFVPENQILETECLGPHTVRLNPAAKWNV